MSSFIDRNLVPRAPAGAEIPQGARRAILTVLQNGGSSPTTVWQLFLHNETFDRWDEIYDDIAARLGEEASQEFENAMTAFRIRDKHRMWANPGVNYDADPALLALPAPYFLTAVEYALVSLRGGAYGIQVMNEINAALNKVGASYRLDFNGQACWHGDTGVHDQVVRPALDALADPRLAGCASEYHAALNHMRGGTAKDLEDVIEESGKAVESAMKVVLDEHGVTRTGKETAFPLFKMLVDNGICPQEADNAVLGVARIRNNLGGHGTGAQPRVLPDGTPELAVNSAATAIKYLAEQLP